MRAVSRVRYRFGPFLISPAHRTVRQDGTELPLIPRYFDLLVLLVAERHRVVTRQEIFDRVWSDVVVSDGALSQAIRTIRRSLGDDPREPRFIRTVSRHGYQFVALDVTEDKDDGPLDAVVPQTAAAVETMPAVPAQGEVPIDRIDELLAKLLREGVFQNVSDEERREAAEELHVLGTERAIERLDERPGHAEARAILRDARWDVPGAGDVKLIGTPASVNAILQLIRLRLRWAIKETSNRWSAAALGGTLAGLLAGLAGGVALWMASGPNGRGEAVLALAIVGAVAGALGTAGIGAGLAAAEALARSARTFALVACGALGGLVAGMLAHVVMRAFVSGMFGRDLSDVGGWLEGLVLGGAAGLGYAWATSLVPGGGLAAPRGAARVRAALVTGGVCAVGAVIATLAGGHFVGASLDTMAASFDGSAVGLGPLASALGEGDLRPVTKTVASAFEGLLFGIGLTAGLTHRPRH
jgi:DNA-binding winged helix-turn-helix (wHTH) protein